MIRQDAKASSGVFRVFYAKRPEKRDQVPTYPVDSGYRIIDAPKTEIYCLSGSTDVSEHLRHKVGQPEPGDTLEIPGQELILPADVTSAGRLRRGGYDRSGPCRFSLRIAAIPPLPPKCWRQQPGKFPASALNDGALTHRPLPLLFRSFSMFSLIQTVCILIISAASCIQGAPVRFVKY